MGTKNNPGAFDCYANAEPDEPMFVLLGRDRHAAALVNLWAFMRIAEGATDPTKVNEALECSTAMFDHFRRVKPDAEVGGLFSLAIGLISSAAAAGLSLRIDAERISFEPLEPNATQH